MKKRYNISFYPYIYNNTTYNKFFNRDRLLKKEYNYYKRNKIIYDIYFDDNEDIFIKKGKRYYRINYNKNNYYKIINYKNINKDIYIKLNHLY